MNTAPSPLDRPWRILVVDDTEQDAHQTAERLQRHEFAGLKVEAEPCIKFEEAKQWLQERIYDLVVLDLVKNGPASFRIDAATVEDPEEAGIQVLEFIKATRPLPVVFYTAHPLKLEGRTNIVASVVDRGQSPERLISAVSKVIASGVPTLARRIEDIQRRYLWEFAATHTNAIEDGGIPNELEMLLARRLAFALRETTLDGQSAETVRPIEFYIYPEPEGNPRAGCVVRRKANGAYALLVTPTCDLVQKPHHDPKQARERKATNVLLANCRELSGEVAFKTWCERSVKNAQIEPLTKTAEQELQKAHESLKRILTGRSPQEDRLFYLPAAHSWPDLLADFQDTTSMPFDRFETEYERVATLDSPFAEAALARFSRYFGRLGTPDLDMDFVLKRLAPKPDPSA